ncbi:MAG: ABC transporter ATP-binding protein [Burkholderiales bacterium]|nr:ABC transporter ATP-binding protein [Burkholderiales bacterium]
MIRVESLTKSYLTLRGRKTVFRDLSFVVPPDRNVGMIGRNGAGKSTMMRLLAGVDLPDKGRIITPSRLSWPVGLSGGMNTTASGRENVRFVCRLYGVRGDAMKRVEEFVADFAEIGEWFDQPVSTYSSGMKARVAFGSSMAFQFDYYLIDEAMSVGDARFKAKSRELFKERLQTARVILVSHSMKQIKAMCDVIVYLDGGRATVYEDVDEGIAAYERMGGRD